MYGHSHRMVVSVMSDLFGVKMSLWLKDRRGRTLSDEDILHYHKIVVALAETIKLMQLIDAAIPSFSIK